MNTIPQPAPKAPTQLPAGWSVKPCSQDGRIFYKVFQQNRYRLSFPSRDGAIAFIRQQTARHSSRQEMAS